MLQKEIQSAGIPHRPSYFVKNGANLIRQDDPAMMT